MKFVMTCTTEELALLVSLSGYSNVAKGIAESSIGEKSVNEWNAIMEVTIHQLMLKQMWDYEKAMNDEIPLSEEMQSFIRGYVESKWMIRCSNFIQQSILIFHHIEKDTWLTHVIERDIIHEFSYITQDEIPSIIEEYYLFKPDNLINQEEFYLSDKAFDLLSKKDNVKKVLSMSNFLPIQQQSFSKFLDDLELQKWSIYNISLFSIPSLEKEPTLENIVFFLPSSKGIWIVEYTDHSSTPIKIQLSSHEQWKDLLMGVGSVAALIGEEK